jgi:hypothetical protein
LFVRWFSDTRRRGDAGAVGQVLGRGEWALCRFFKDEEGGVG